MLTFRKFRSLLNEALSSEDKLTHLYHNEEHVFNFGKDGFKHAMGNIHALSNFLKSGKASNRVQISTKLDGAPSLVFGYHPINGRFFVGTKSVFNKVPKINYTNKDIDENHGHAAGLVEKLRLALQHLPKVAPKQGVYQCDVMFSKSDVRQSKNGLSFKPNTITYTITPANPDFEKAKRAQFSVAVHTKYTGKPDNDYHINGMRATFGVDHNSFKNHRDVLLISPMIGEIPPEYTQTQQQMVKDALKIARSLNRKVTERDYDAVGLHNTHVLTYFNVKVRDGGKPSIEDYFNYVKEKLEKDVNNMKSDKGKASKQEVLDMFITHFNNNRASFDRIFSIHKYIQQAKNTIVDVLSKNPTMKHTVDGKKVKPEGFVIVKDGRPTKFVDRAEFSRLNFQNNRGRG